MFAQQFKDFISHFKEKTHVHEEELETILIHWADFYLMLFVREEIWSENKTTILSCRRESGFYHSFVLLLNGKKKLNTIIDCKVDFIAGLLCFKGDLLDIKY